MNISKDLFCIFKTSLGEEYRIPETRINLKAESTHEDLSNILQAILKTRGIEKNVKFNFELQGELIKGSLSSHMSKVGMTNESTLEIYYSISIGAPSFESSFKDQNWINRLFPIDFNEIVSCTFEAQVTSLSCEDLSKKKGVALVSDPINPLRNICTVELFEDDSKLRVLTSNFFGNIVYEEIVKESFVIKNHKREEVSSNVSAMCFNPIDPNIFYTGDEEGIIKGWKVSSKLGVFNEKTEAHSGYILKLNLVHQNQLMSLGKDNMLRIWDIPSFTQISFLNFKDSPITFYENQTNTNCVLTGHIHGQVRMFDDRENSKTTSKMFKSHNFYVSSIRFNPSNPSIFASSDYSGSLKIWDMRADFPLYSISCHDNEKIFDIAWTSNLIRRSNSVHWRSGQPGNQTWVQLNKKSNFKNSLEDI